MIRTVCLLLLLAALALGARAADGLQALRETVVPTPAAGLPYADALADAGRAEDAARLRLGLLDAHVAQLEGRPWPAPRRLGEVMDAVVDPARARAGLAERWEALFPGLGTLRWGGPPPPMLAGMQPAPVEVAPGAWVAPAPSGGADCIAQVQWENRSATPLTLPSLQIVVKPSGGEALAVVCNPLSGRAGDVVAPAAARSFLCRGQAPASATPLWARAARGTLAGGEQLVLRPAHFRSAGGLEDLAAAIGSATPLDRAAWVTRLVGVPLPAATPAPTAASAAAATPVAAPAPTVRVAEPPPPSVVRPLLAVAGSAAFLLLLVRLVLGHLDEDPPGYTVARTLPWVIGMLVLAVVVGSSPGQQAIHWVLGPGFRQAVLALQRTNQAAPTGWTLDGLLERAAADGQGSFALLLGIGLFALERAATRAGVPELYARATTLVLRVLLCAPGLLAAVGASAALGPLVGLALGAAALAPFLASWLVTYALRKGFATLDDEDLGWPTTIARALRGTPDFTGTASRGEFWGPVMAWLLASLLAAALWKAATAWVFWGLLVPLPALAVRRFRGLDSAETDDLNRWALGWLHRWARRWLREQRRRL